jgi:hypothetical protein
VDDNTDRVMNVLKRLAIRAVPVLVNVLVVAGCSQSTPPVSSPVKTSPNRICAEVGGSWDPTSETCSLTGTNATKHITVEVTAKYPAALVDDPTAGPALNEFLRAFFARFGHPGNEFAHDGYARLNYQTYRHGADVQSIVFYTNYDLGGVHPLADIDTFTFDFKRKIELHLADLFCPGVDPLKALPPLARPYVQAVVNPKGNPTFDIRPYEPGDYGRDYGENYSGNYKAWYLDNDNLVLVMPTSRSGPTPPGMFEPHVPLSALLPVSPEGGCSV